jgi:hypothetical protein
MTHKNLKEYIRLTLNETKSLTDLENNYSEEIDTLNQNFYSQQEKQVHGWSDLNKIIKALENIPSYDLFTSGRPEKMDEILTTIEYFGYELIGKGFYRKVYSRPDVPWIIKTQLAGNINKHEAETYFSYGETGDWVRYDLFPKLYGIDEEDAMWVIWEKVTPFDQSNEVEILKKLFPAFTGQLTKIHQSLNMPELEPFDKELSFSRQIFPMLYALIEEYSDWGSTDQSFDDHYRKYLLYRLPGFHTGAYSLYNNTELLAQALTGIKFPKDIKYLYDFFSNAEGHPRLIEDLKSDNLGYRNLDDNPSEPWRNLVILDLGEY